MRGKKSGRILFGNGNFGSNALAKINYLFLTFYLVDPASVICLIWAIASCVCSFLRHTYAKLQGARSAGRFRGTAPPVAAWLLLLRLCSSKDWRIHGDAGATSYCLIRVNYARFDRKGQQVVTAFV